MWILSDKAMETLLHGNQELIVTLAQANRDITIKELYRWQFNYKTYSGFRKFYTKYIQPLLDDITYIGDDTIVGRILKRII